MGNNIDPKKIKQQVIICIIVAVGTLIYGGYLSFEFHQLEVGAIKEISAPGIVVKAYNIIGKWGVLAISIVLGAYLLFEANRLSNIAKKTKNK